MPPIARADRPYLTMSYSEPEKREGSYVLFFNVHPVLSPAEYEALQGPAAAFMNITPEEITKKTEEKR